MKRLTPLLLICMLMAFQPVHAQPLRLAVAANAQFVMKQLRADFSKRTGIETEAIVSSSGKLVSQIKNGAPFDIFFSADMDFPNALYREGFAVSAAKEYALGSLVVCSNTLANLGNWRRLISGDDVQKIAIANPAVAPYGKAAQEALEHYGLWDQLRSKIVYGESISQVNTYITTGTVSIGFTTEALVYEYQGKGRLKWERVDKNVYGKIRQGFVILSYSKKRNYEKAKQFYNYILSPPAQKILKQFGYLLS